MGTSKTYLHPLVHLINVGKEEEKAHSKLERQQAAEDVWKATEPHAPPSYSCSRTCFLCRPSESKPVCVRPGSAGPGLGAAREQEQEQDLSPLAAAPSPSQPGSTADRSQQVGSSQLTHRAGVSTASLKGPLRTVHSTVSWEGGPWAHALRRDRGAGATGRCQGQGLPWGRCPACALGAVQRALPSAILRFSAGYHRVFPAYWICFHA